MMRVRSFSIRDILWLTVSILTLLIALLVGREVLGQWHQLQKIESLKEATLFSDKLFEAIEKISVERDIAFAILHVKDTKDLAELHERLDASRPDTDAAFQAALAPLEKFPFPELGELRHNVDAHLADIHTLRRQIDQAIAIPNKEGDEAVAMRWYSEVTALISETEQLWQHYIRHFTDINPIVTQHLHYKQFLLTISDYTARERSSIGRLLVENASPTPEEIGQLLRWQGTIDLAWKSAYLLADQSGLYATVGPYFKDAQSQYMTMYDMVRDIFYAPGAHHGVSYPISINLWFELSTQASDSLNALKDVSKDAKHRYVEKLESDRKRAISWQLAVLLLALSLCFYCFRIISYRVIRPINAMVDALVDATQGKPVSFIPQVAGRQDEIGKLADVLHSFRESGERYRALIEASAQIVWTWRPGDVGDLNTLQQWWEGIAGPSREPFVPFGWLEKVHPEDRQYVKDSWVHASATGENVTMELRLLALTGEYRWIFIRAVALKNPDGSIREMVGATNDITDRKLAEQQVEAAHKFIEDMLNHIPDPIFMKDREHKWIGGNKAFWEIMNGPPEKFIGKSDYEFFPKEEADVFWETDNKVLNSDGIDINEEFFTDADGQRHVFSTKKVSFHNEQGEKFLVGVIRDITEIKETEAKLLRYTDALELSNRELDDFAYIASHDLKEPLRGIHNHSRFLLEDNQDKLDADSVRKLDRLIYLSQRMERLVNDLLYFSRLGRQQLAIQETDINEVVQDIEKTLEVFLEERHARITIPQALPTITCDKTRVTELFRNLITNAVKYNDKPEKMIEIGYVPTHIGPDGITYKNVFYVRDNGRGIEQEFYEEIFRIFKRLQSNKDSPEEGTGVGLTFVKKIIERHGGRIWLESEVGAGTSFYFTLEDAHGDIKTAK